MKAILEALRKEVSQINAGTSDSNHKESVSMPDALCSVKDEISVLRAQTTNLEIKINAILEHLHEIKPRDL